MGPSIRVAIAQGPSIGREALCRILDREQGLELVGLAGTASELDRLTAVQRPDVVLLDHDLPGDTLLGALQTLRSQSPPPLVVVLGQPDELGTQAILHGAQGTIRREAAPTELLKAIRAVAAGECWVGREAVAGLVGQLGRSSRSAKETTPFEGLTPRERQVADAVAAGDSNRDVARRLGVSEGGVKSLLRRIYRKLGVPNRAALTTLVVRWQARSGAESAPDRRQE